MDDRQHPPDRASAPHHHSRRDFLKGVGAATLALTAAACVPLPAPVDRPAVALAHARTYDRAAIRVAMRDMLDGIGGLRDIVSRGDRVAIKTNLTGGTFFKPPLGFFPTESFLTHPEVVRAVGELLRDAGARELFIVEAVYDKESYPLFGYEDVANDLGATLLDLNRPDPYTDFAGRAGRRQRRNRLRRFHLQPHPARRGRVRLGVQAEVPLQRRRHPHHEEPGRPRACRALHPQPGPLVALRVARDRRPGRVRGCRASS